MAGLCRFATSDYVVPDASARSIKNKYMHLTNYSINKRSEEFVWNTDADADDEGSKWSLSALWRYLAEQGVDVAVVRERIRDIAVKTLIAAVTPPASSPHRPAPQRVEPSAFAHPTPLLTPRLVGLLARPRGLTPTYLICRSTQLSPNATKQLARSASR